MANLYKDIVRRSIEQGFIDRNTIDARQWFREESQQITPAVARKNIRSEFIKNSRSLITVGRLYMFRYEPVTKETLPYYDLFPVVFPFQKTPQGFLGLNMHYLPPLYRAILMDRLYLLINNDRYDDSTRLQKMSYEMLSGVSRFRYFKPCVRHYLYNNVMSRFLYVHPKHWEIALFLPLEQFRKAAKNKIYRDSIGIIKGNR